ncbi:MAG: hypothetical protein WB804_00150 [Candidatus Dormiibacterota bacterium]
MTFWRGVLVFAGVAVGFGIIGAVIGRLTAKGSAHELHFVPSAIPATQRQAIAYLDVVVAWHSYLRAVRTLVYPEEGPPAHGSRDLAAVIECRAELQSTGSLMVQDLHDQALESAVTLIDLLRSATYATSPNGAEPSTQRLGLRVALSAIEERVSALENQVLYEAGHLPSLPEVEVEMTGRPAVRGRQSQTMVLH